MLRRLVICTAVAIVAAACFGAAASLTATGDTTSAGSAPTDLDCAAGTSVAYAYSGAEVVSVQVSNLPAACQGGRISLTLTDATGTAVSQAPAVVANGANATLDVANVAASSVKQYVIAVVR